ncbi:hypothetical protein XSR1_150041 [Xenorhabdus szentirmaii DSM 16338]|uniref:Uncharacterized protein n=1 Tax=Xenorhabdus szentirmaii DSM 16338 TaxID=1427518 RepID=W1IT70_9GAMM|nr:hypothetical protein XSR1_150041 [Xenorhabdus szentirmaii DSM 16338]
MGFRQWNEKYYNKINVEDIIINNKSINYPSEKITSLNKEYELQFYCVKTGKSFHPERLLLNTLATPLTLAGDILILPPIYLLAIFSGVGYR